MCFLKLVLQSGYEMSFVMGDESPSKGTGNIWMLDRKC